MAKPATGPGEITVILPPEPPQLNPGAARVLLKILLKAYEKQHGHEYQGARESESSGMAAVDQTSLQTIDKL